MATYTLFDDVSRRNDTQHRSRSRQLEEFRRGDWSTMATELANVISNDAPIQLRHVPVVPGVCDVMATMYVRRPDREFSGKQLATLEAESLWRRAGAERALRRAEHALTAAEDLLAVVERKAEAARRLVGKVAVLFGDERFPVAEIRDA